MAATLRIYGDIAEDDMFAKLFGLDDETVSAKKVANWLEENKAADEIIVRINSRGGDVQEGWAIHDLLVNSGKRLKTVGEGKVYSIATVIFLAADEREFFKNADGLIHNPFVQPFGEPYASDDLLKMAESLQYEEKKILDFYVQRTGTDEAKLAEYMKEDTKLSADDMLALGFATKIVEPVKAYAFIKPKSNFAMTPQEEQKFFDKVGDALTRVLTALGLSRLPEKSQELTDKDGKKFKLDKETGAPAVGDAASPDGVYTMASGEVITVQDGKITEIKPAEQETELDRLTRENAALTQQVTDLTAKVAAADALTTETATAKAALDAKTAEVTALAVELEGLKNKWKPAARSGGHAAVDGEINTERVQEVREKLKS
jgi:ATP-dependent Clp protease protease subunit